MTPHIEKLKANLERDPENVLFRFSLAQALFNAGAFEEALPHLETCALARADWMVPRILLGKALLELDQAAPARPWLEAAHRLAVEQNHQDPANELQQILEGFDD